MNTLLRQVFVAILGGVVAAGAMFAANHYKPGPNIALAQTSISEVPANSPAGVDAPDVDASKMINYQGQIFNPNSGQPFVGAVNMRFSFWDSANGGTLQYSEDRNIITNSDGFFSTNIGSNTNFNFGNTTTYSLFDGEALFLEVATLDAQLNPTPLGPRQPLTFVPFALWAVHAHHLDNWDADDFPKIVAHGVVNANGTKRSGERFSSTITEVGGQNGVYVISVEGHEDVTIENYNTIVTPACESPVFHGIGSSLGDLVVDIWNPNGQRVQCTFQFMVLQK
jgi:hypothetical protein